MWTLGIRFANFPEQIIPIIWCHNRIFVIDVWMDLMMVLQLNSNYAVIYMYTELAKL